uniref:Uncharacterized protein n=1 Tax=Brassica oleracea var. oleracea TaxID=109376 RepID=A0A0D3BN23_BRAOL
AFSARLGFSPVTLYVHYSPPFLLVSLRPNYKSRERTNNTSLRWIGYPDNFEVSWRQGRYYFAMNENVEEQKKGKYVLIRDGGDEEGNELGGLFYKPLPCFGLGIGWLSFLLGFFFPFAWYFATFLYLTNYYRRDPRERSGLAASAIAVSFDIHRCTVDHRACSCFLGSLELLVYSFWGGWRSCLLLRTKKTTTKTCNIAANPAKTTPTVSPLFNPPLFGSSGDPNLRGSGGGGKDSDLGCGGCC